jgi:hypothetical protein
MTKNILLAAIMLILLSSCQKQWTCTTYMYDPGGTEVIMVETFWGTSKDMKAKEQAGNTPNSHTDCK